MNAERLHAIVRALNEEMQATNVIDELQAVVNSLRSLVQQSTASNQQNLASNLNDLYTSLSNAPSDRFSPTWRQILIEIGGEELFGTKLKQKIEEALAKNQLTPAVALNELERILGQMQQFREALKQ